LKAEKLNYFKEMLKKEKEKLLENMERMKNGEVFVDKDSIKDVVDAASDELDKAFVMRIRDRELKLIKKIDEALKRIEEGSYGICEECGCDIEEKRLNARPVATLCIACKEEQEEQEKRLEKQGK
jgi:DnaK suppressor protein